MPSTESKKQLRLLLLGRHTSELATIRQWFAASSEHQQWQIVAHSSAQACPPCDIIVLHLFSTDADFLYQMRDVLKQKPSLVITPDALTKLIPEHSHQLPAEHFHAANLIEACEALQHDVEFSRPLPLERDAFFATLRQLISQQQDAVYLKVLQCRWLTPINNDNMPWAVRHRIQQEFEQTILAHAPADAITGRILDDQLVVVSNDYYALQADWFPASNESQGSAWMIYSSAVLQLTEFKALSTVLQEGVQQIARERLVQEAQFDWNQQQHSLSLYEGLHLALQRDEFFLEFQPQFDSRSGAWVGAEALLRWRHPHLGVIPPTVFIREAENAGLIQALGQWALRETIIAWSEINQRTGNPIRMAVNVSFPEVADPFYSQQVIELLQQQQMPPHFLELELTETAMMRDTSVSLMNLKNLQQYGIHIALDDFGTGFSSLSHLSDLPITGIKLDRAFVAPMAEKGPQAHIVSTMLDLAKRLRLETTAEGVEDKQCLELVQKLGCDRIQGYIYSRPLNLEALIQQAESGFISNDFNQRSLF